MILNCPDHFVDINNMIVPAKSTYHFADVGKMIIVCKGVFFFYKDVRFKDLDSSIFADLLYYPL